MEDVVPIWPPSYSQTYPSKVGVCVPDISWRDFAIDRQKIAEVTLSLHEKQTLQILWQNSVRVTIQDSIQIKTRLSICTDHIFRWILSCMWICVADKAFQYLSFHNNMCPEESLQSLTQKKCTQTLSLLNFSSLGLLCENPGYFCLISYNL